MSYCSQCLNELVDKIKGGPRSVGFRCENCGRPIVSNRRIV